MTGDEDDEGEDRVVVFSLLIINLTFPRLAATAPSPLELH